MIHVVTKNRVDTYRPQFEAMHGLLHKIYAEKRGWPDADGWLDRGRDDVDTDAEISALPPDPELAIYLMRICETGTLSAAVRLSPSEFRLTQFDQAFGSAFSNLPSGPNIWDAGQLCLKDAPDKAVALAEIALGTLEFALTWGIAQICVLLDHDILQATRYLPFEVEFAGRAFDYLGERFVPTMLPVSASGVEGLRALLPNARPHLHLRP